MERSRRFFGGVLHGGLQFVAGRGTLREGVGGVQVVVLHGIQRETQHRGDGVGQLQSAGPDGVETGGGVGHGQVTGADREGDVIFRLGEPLQKFHAGFDLGIGALGHDHAGTLLGGNGGAARKAGAGQDRHLNVVALGVTGQHLLGEEGGTGRGTYIGKQVAGLHVIAAEAAAGPEPTLEEGNIVVVPQLAHHVFVKVQGHDAVLGIKDGHAQLLCAAEQVVRQRVTAEESLAVVGGVGLGVGPVVIFVGCFGHALYGGKVVIGHAGGGGEGGPVSRVQVEQLGGFRHGEDLQLAVVHQVALF